MWLLARNNTTACKFSIAFLTGTEWKAFLCSLLSFSSNNYSSSNLFPYYINNGEITSRSHHKDLGITMSSELSWSKHIAQISSKAYRIFCLLHITFSATTASQQERVYTFPWSSPNYSTVLRFGEQFWSKIFIVWSKSSIKQRNSFWMTTTLITLMMTVEICSL